MDITQRMDEQVPFLKHQPTTQKLFSDDFIIIYFCKTITVIST